MHLTCLKRVPQQPTTSRNLLLSCLPYHQVPAAPQKVPLATTGSNLLAQLTEAYLEEAHSETRRVEQVAVLRTESSSSLRPAQTEPVLLLTTARRARS